MNLNVSKEQFELIVKAAEQVKGKGDSDILQALYNYVLHCIEFDSKLMKGKEGSALETPYCELAFVLISLEQFSRFVEMAEDKK